MSSLLKKLAELRAKKEREEKEREEKEREEKEMALVQALVQAQPELEQEYADDDGYVNEEGEDVIDEGEEVEEGEDVIDEGSENEGGEEGEEGRLVNEFGAFGAGGRSGGRSFQFAENEEEQFWNNMEQFLLHQYDNTSSLVRENFSKLVKKYPHPRTLSPVLCNLIHIFYSDTTNKYVWDLKQYDTYKQRHENEFPNVQKHEKYYPFPSQLHFLRYIHLFNTFAI